MQQLLSAVSACSLVTLPLSFRLSSELFLFSLYLILTFMCSVWSCVYFCLLSTFPSLSFRRAFSLTAEAVRGNHSLLLPRDWRGNSRAERRGAVKKKRRSPCCAHRNHIDYQIKSERKLGARCGTRTWRDMAPPI